MKGILLISHGKMAEGLEDTCRFVMGESLSQIDHCCLEAGESPEDYRKRLIEKLRSVDTGEGVIVFCDLYGGTPCKEAIMQLNEKMDLVAGMNFPLVLETITSRLNEDINIEELVQKGNMGIVDVRKAIEAVQYNDFDE